MVRHTKPLQETVRVVIVPEASRSSIRVCGETQGMINRLSSVYSKRAGYRVSANSVLNLLAQNALKELEVSK